MCRLYVAICWSISCLFRASSSFSFCSNSARILSVSSSAVSTWVNIVGNDGSPSASVGSYLSNKGGVDEDLGCLVVSSFLRGGHRPSRVNSLDLWVELVELLICEDVVLVPPGQSQLVEHGSHLRCLDLRIRHGLKLKSWSKHNHILLLYWILRQTLLVKISGIKQRFFVLFFVVLRGFTVTSIFTRILIINTIFTFSFTAWNTRLKLDTRFCWKSSL